MTIHTTIHQNLSVDDVDAVQTELENAARLIVADMRKLTDKSNVAAGTRSRKNMINIKKWCDGARKTINGRSKEIKQARKEAAESKAEE